MVKGLLAVSLHVVTLYSDYTQYTWCTFVVGEPRFCVFTLHNLVPLHTQKTLGYSWFNAGAIMSCCGHEISCTLSLHVYYNKAHYSLVTPVSSLCRVNAGEQSFNIIPAFLISIASMLIPHWGKQGESATPSLPADSPARSTAGTLFPLAVLGIST